MAHAGTPTDLAKQPATSRSSGQVGLWKALLTAIVILAIGFGMVMAISFIAGNRATSVPAVDTSYNAVENARGAALLSGVSVDTSYDAVENARGAALLSGVSVDRSFDQIEGQRGATNLP